LEHPERLAKYLLFVGDEINDAIRDDDVRRVVSDWQMFEFPEAEFDIVRADAGGVIACLLQHLMGHIDADHLAGVADLSCRKKTVNPGAAAEIDHDLAWLHRGNCLRIAAAKTEICPLGYR